MNRKWLWYGGFFILLLGAFWYFLFAGTEYYKVKLPVLAYVSDFTFTDQNRKPFTNKEMEGKVYVAEYFFTTCKGICPKMNFNMKKVYDQFRDEPGFAVVSHTCMPETDSVPLLKAYEKRIFGDSIPKTGEASWYFVTGIKDSLYRMARESYLLDNEKNNSINIKDQFIHTQFFALVDKEHRLRGVYDGLRNEELDKLSGDIKGLLKEHSNKVFNNSTFTNNPN